MSTLLLVVEYLRYHTFQQLEDEHGVCARAARAGDKFALNYSQILAKSGDLLAEQCRGLVIRTTQFNTCYFGDNWKHAIVGDVAVLAWPMNRFYNYGDAAATEIDWSHPSLKVYEKVDGTCIILYWDPLARKWHCGTRSVPEADLPIQVGHVVIGDMTFSQLFLKALIATYEELSGEPVYWEVTEPDDVIINLNKELTYVFELVSPYNQIVVTYPMPRAYLLAARHTQTGKEVPIENLHFMYVRRPKTWFFRDAGALSCFVDAANPTELEGAVVCVQVGDSFKRQKVKNKTYVLAHRTKDTVMSSQRNALEAIILGKADDIIPLVPSDVQDKLRAMQRAFNDYCCDIDEKVAAYKHEANGSRKQFAARVLLNGGFTAVYFNLWENHALNAHEWFAAACKNNKLTDASLDTILSKLTL